MIATRLSLPLYLHPFEPTPVQGGIIYNHHLSAEQIEIRDTVRAFVRDEVKPVTLHPSRLEPFAKPLLTDLLGAASNMGLRALLLPEAAGGAGADQLTACMVAEELAQGDPDIAMVLAHTAALASVLFGEAMMPAARERHLPQFRDDPACHLAYAGRHPDAGSAVDYHRAPSDVVKPSATARKQGSEWIIEGEFSAAANAGVAQLFAVQALAAGASMMFLVPRGAAGLTVQEASAERGGSQRRWGHGVPGKVILNGCKVPASDVIEGAAAERYWQSVTLQTAAANIGIGQVALEAAIDYTKLRRQGGKKTIEHQGIGVFLADIAIKLEAARNMVWKAAWVLDHPDAVADRSVSPWPLALMARAYTAEAMISATERASECFGAMGVMRDMPLQKYVDDALMFKHGEVSVADTKLRVAEAIAGYPRKT